MIAALAVVVTAAALWLAWSLVRRGRRDAAGWDAAIAEHLAATGDYPTVEDWRAGRIGCAALGDTQEFPPADDDGPDDGRPDGPVTVTVRVVEPSRPELGEGGS